VYQTTNIQIKPYDDITINSDYASGSTPKDLTNPIDPAVLNNNSINIIDRVYNTKSGTTKGDVATNIDNDFVY
jgi:hypothetical protein